MKKLAIIIALTGTTAFAQDGNIFPEGGFETGVTLSDQPGTITKDFTAAAEGTLYIEPGDYKAKGISVTVESEEGSNFLRYTVPAASSFTGILRTYIVLALPDPKPSTVTVSLRWRLEGFAPASGAPEWASAQIEPAFLLADNKLKVANGTFRLKESTSEWLEVEKNLTVPEGATHIVLQPGLYCAQGTLDVDDIKIIPEQ